jgi:hypothetical protein
MCRSSMSSLKHRLGLTPRQPVSDAAKRQTRTRMPHCKAPLAQRAGSWPPGRLIHGSGDHPQQSNPINSYETAMPIRGGRSMRWAEGDADGMRIDSAGNPKDCFTVLA